MPSQPEVEAWREHPVTRTLRRLIDHLLADEREAITEAYWAGRPVTEARKLAFDRYADFALNVFGADADEIEAAMEQMNDQRERDTPS